MKRIESVDVYRDLLVVTTMSGEIFKFRTHNTNVEQLINEHPISAESLVISPNVEKAKSIDGREIWYNDADVSGLCASLEYIGHDAQIVLTRTDINSGEIKIWATAHKGAKIDLCDLIAHNYEDVVIFPFGASDTDYFSRLSVNDRLGYAENLEDIQLIYEESASDLKTIKALKEDEIFIYDFNTSSKTVQKRFVNKCEYGGYLWHVGVLTK